jgi:hypothetical protein
MLATVALMGDAKSRPVIPVEVDFGFMIRLLS